MQVLNVVVLELWRPHNKKLISSSAANKDRLRVCDHYLGVRDTAALPAKAPA